MGRRGVEVTLILPSQTDSWLVFHAGRNYYEQLLRAGVKIHERRVLAVTGRSAGFAPGSRAYVRYRTDGSDSRS